MLITEEFPIARELPAMKTGSIRVVIVDDHQLVRDGLRLLIDQQPDMTVCGEAADEATGSKLVREMRPDILLADISLKFGNGIDLIKWVREYVPEVRTVVSTTYEERIYGERTLRAGAKGYVNKNDPAATIIEAIRRVREGKLYFSEELTSRMLQLATKSKEPSATPGDVLSDRELQIFALIGKGIPSSEIATQLHLSRSTVDTYRERIKSKLAIENASELTFRAFQWNQQQGN